MTLASVSVLLVGNSIWVDDIGLGSGSVTLVKTDKNILIDTGLLGFSIKEKIIQGLNKEGITKEQIDVIINTHLHHDHCGNNHLFRGKELIVHQKEILFAEKTYWPEYLDANVYPLGVHTIDKTLRIADDVKIIETPGHTPGSISVMVKTGEGYVLIAGDTVQTKDQFYSRSLGIFSCDKEALLKSLNKIAEMPLHLIIPGHDSPFTP